MAGAVSKGLEGSRTVNLNIAIEARGITYGGGGDPGAITIPNYIKHYSPNVIGGSVGEHWVEFCYFGICPKWQCNEYDFSLKCSGILICFIKINPNKIISMLHKAPPCLLIWEWS